MRYLEEASKLLKEKEDCIIHRRQLIETLKRDDDIDYLNTHDCYPLTLVYIYTKHAIIVVHTASAQRYL